MPGNVERDHFRLEVQADPCSVSGVRDAVGREALRLGLPEERVGDLKTVVSEVCNNVVLHAYPSDVEDRPLEVEMQAEEGELRVAVRDRGEGIRPPGRERPRGLRMGLLLVGAITSCFQLKSGRGRGTELLLRVPLRPQPIRGA